MKTIFCTILCSLGFVSFTQVNNVLEASDKAQNLVGNQSGTFNPFIYVMPTIGTGGHGHTFPGVCAPFGMMQLSPDTRHDGWDGCGGYHYSDSLIYGFSHTHLSGTGVPDYADLLIVPQSGKKAKVLPKYQDKEKGYGSKFSHTKEKARAGFYEVFLEDEQINVRLTTSERSGIHEYTFLNVKGKKYVLLDLDYRDKVLNAGFEILNDSTISGKRISEAWANEQHFYFHLETSIPFISSKSVKIAGTHKLLLEFPKNTKVLYVKVGMSHVDQKGAAHNLQMEIPRFDFMQVYSRNIEKWNNELSKIKIESQNFQDAVIFYTSFYHSMVAPNLMSDLDGRYRGRDQKIHQLVKDNQYTVFSLWDTYRGNHPLFTLVQQERTTQFIRTFLRQFDEGGDLPVWELAACETECMIGYHSVSVMSDAYMKGIDGKTKVTGLGYDAKKALNDMHFTANIDEFGKQVYAKNGYLSSSDEPESVSKTLEYSYDDFCIAEMAQAMGNTEMEKNYRKRSFSFINLFDPNTKFMRARRGAQWYGPFDPSEVNFNYTEANSWQYSLYAPHEIEVLTNLLGGRDSLEAWLDRLFTTEMKLSGREQADITGLIGQYAHGNEPSHHMAYLYNFTNAPYKTQYYVDRILKEMYQAKPDGLSGNEDCGQMSAWYVLSSLGLYPIAPGNTMYQIGRPLFSKATIKVDNQTNAKIEIICNNQGAANCYVSSVKWNGKLIPDFQIDHKTLMLGGKLEFEMTDKKPARSNYPQMNSVEIPSDFVPAPFVKTELRIFEQELYLELGHVVLTPSDSYELKYRLNNGPWNNYVRPLKIKETTTIDLQLLRVNEAGVRSESAIVSSQFIRKNSNLSLTLDAKYSNQYAASGENALIDGLYGGNEFRTGDWQGYYGKDVVATVTFKDPVVIHEIGASCIRDQKSWIFLPKEIRFEVSYDGITFQNPKVISIPQATQTDKNPYNLKFTQILESDKTLKVKRIRYTLVNPGNCPEWHLGAGNPTWLFIDELIFN
jgi:predicted alpha-1,2-mannosidase